MYTVILTHKLRKYCRRRGRKVVRGGEPDICCEMASSIYDRKAAVMES